MVRPVNLVDQKYRVARGFQRLQNGARNQELIVIQVDVIVARLPDREHLPWEVPLVHGGRCIDTFITLQAHQFPPKNGCQRLGGFGLADARRPFKQERFAQSQGEVGRRRKPFVRDILRVAQGSGQRIRPVDPLYGAPHRHQSACRGFAPPMAWIPRNTFSGVTGNSSIRTPTAS